ncbi:MAG: branched-chain amino acid ABC transporter permease [Deltaproteobacteria bacterium]|jgi:branched-chain amino acid transport system permease protein|nr:MAG: branched-chain amino acid ABC transporter permease [Deltaproteobacteria bacterium]
MYRPCGTFDETYIQDIAIIRTPMHWSSLIAGIILLFSLPFLVSGKYLSLLNLIGISIISVHGLSILTGYTGQISLGQAAFMAVGAYTTGLLAVYLKFPFWLALPCSGVITGITGIIFGLPSLRIKGFYLAMATLAAQFIIPWLIVNVRPDLTGGTDTLVVPTAHIGSFAFNSQERIFYLVVPMAILVTFLVRSLVRTRIGRAFTAIRDNDLAAEAMGISLFRYKLLAFFICSFYAGIAGSLWAYWMRAINIDYFLLSDSIWYLGMVIVGGMGSVPGAVFGTVFIRTLDLLVKNIAPWLGTVVPSLAGVAAAALGPFVFGLIILVFLIFEPRGLAHRWEVIKSYFRLWPFSY